MGARCRRERAGKDRPRTRGERDEDMDEDVIASVLPSMEARAREMQPKTI